MEDINSMQPPSHEPSRSSGSNFQSFLLPGAILIAAVVISGTLLYTRANPGVQTAQIGNEEDTKPVNIAINDQDHILGNKDAAVTIVEFSDFQCPFCRSFFEASYQDIKKEYIDTGKARLIFRHFPLDFHPGAKPAALGSECAAEQGKFWEFHDKVFQEQAKLGQGTVQFTTTDIKRWAASLKLNMAQFNKCFDTSKYAKRVTDDAAYGASVNVTGTPSFFVNGTRLVGAQPFASFKTTIDAALANLTK